MSDVLVRFHSRDVRRVEETWQRYVPSARLDRVDPSRFRFDWTSAQLPGLSIVKYELAAGVRSSVDPHGQVLVCRVHGGGSHVRTVDGEDGAGTPWITDGRAVEAQWDGAAVVQALIFDRMLAQELARQMSGDAGLVLSVTGAMPDRPSDALHWQRTFDYVLQALTGSAADDDILRASLQRHALWTTLATFPTTFRDTMKRSPQTRAAPALVRRALDFIADNASRPITVDDVAGAVHLSTRGLQMAFRRALETTPGEELRRARLAGAHRDLKETEDPIAVVARRWGFSHPSRFAGYYREQYGTAPSGTRRAAR
ncbi:helix-turn-helix transcriptional regulator [Microbacterium sp. NPDC055903]